MPGKDRFADIDLVRNFGMVLADDMGGELGHEAALERGPRTVDPHVLVGGHGKQQKAVIGDLVLRMLAAMMPPALLRGSASSGCRPDNQRQVRHMQPVEPAPDADHPFVVDDLQCAITSLDFRDMGDVALHKRQQILSHLFGHVRVQPGQ